MSINSDKKLIDNYLNEILNINQSINLTRVTNYNAAQLLHIEDSLSILKEFNLAPEGKYIDLGSGGGFPGVPLAIITGRDTTLIDSVKKKMMAVKSILNKLDIHNIEVSDMRIEEFSTINSNRFSVATARAVSSIPALLELASPLLTKDGQLILMKSQEVDEFDKEAAEEKLGMKQVSFREYYLSDNETYRNVYVFKKASEPQVKLPRRTGMAQKRPLVK